eukprot:1159831-Pelagomonas_calceolata.AAC.12
MVPRCYCSSCSPATEILCTACGNCRWQELLFVKQQRNLITITTNPCYRTKNALKVLKAGLACIHEKQMMTRSIVS